jgi:hypothetical protein
MGMGDLTQLPKWAQQHIERLEFKLKNDLGCAEDRILELENMLLDLTECADWNDIQQKAGLKERRCRQIEEQMLIINKRRSRNH